MWRGFPEVKILALGNWFPSGLQRVRSANITGEAA
jgi:hypothetical protein